MARPAQSQLFYTRSRTAFRTADKAIRCAHLEHSYSLFEIDPAMACTIQRAVALCISGKPVMHNTRSDPVTVLLVPI
jgi:hypothetical protein